MQNSNIFWMSCLYDAAKRLQSLNIPLIRYEVIDWWENGAVEMKCPADKAICGEVALTEFCFAYLGKKIWFHQYIWWMHDETYPEGSCVFQDDNAPIRSMWGVTVRSDKYENDRHLTRSQPNWTPKGDFGQVLDSTLHHHLLEDWCSSLQFQFQFQSPGRCQDIQIYSISAKTGK